MGISTGNSNSSSVKAILYAVILHVKLHIRFWNAKIVSHTCDLHSVKIQTLIMTRLVFKRVFNTHCISANNPPFLPRNNLLSSASSTNSWKTTGPNTCSSERCPRYWGHYWESSLIFLFTKLTKTTNEPPYWIIFVPSLYAWQALVCCPAHRRVIKSSFGTPGGNVIYSFQEVHSRIVYINQIVWV